MRMNVCYTIVMISVLVISSRLSLALDGFNVDSSTFTNTFSANEIWDGSSFVNDWSATASPNEAVPFLNGSTLEISTPGGNGWIQQDTGTSAWEGIGSTDSWTIETQLSLESGEALVLWLDPANASTGTILYIHENGTGSAAGTTDFSADSNLGTHTFRLAYDSPANSIFLWRDNVQLTNALVPSNPAGGNRLILGDCCSSFDSTGFDLNYVRYDTTGAFSPIADQGTLALTVNRDSGEIVLANSTSSSINEIVGYTILSSAGSLQQSGWDQQSGSSQLANDDDDWAILTGAGVTTDLGEAVLSTSGSGDGGDLVATTGTWTFGNVWAKTPFEDIAFELIMDDGTRLTSAGSDLSVVYTGDEAITGDIAGATVNDGPDGNIDLVDWAKFKAGINSDLTDATAVEAYLAGDLTGDLRVDHNDFNAFVSAFNAVNPISFAEAIAAVPEPTGIVLLSIGAGLLCNVRSRKKFTHPQFRNKTSMDQPGNSILLKSCRFLVAFAITATLLCSSRAWAVSDFVLATYDADAGNPANVGEIQSPEEQGWSEWASTAQGQDPTIATQQAVIGNDGTNAWLNSDPAETNPGYLVDMSASQIQAAFDFGWRSEFVLTMIEGGHFTSFGVTGGNPWGLPADSRVGFAPSTDGSTITFDPVDNGDGANIVTPAGTVGDFYRVVVTGDAQSTSGQLEVFDFSDGSQVGTTQNFSSWSGGNSLSSDRFSIQSGSSAGTGRVAQIHSMSFVVPAPDTLTLEVNTTTGATRLVNNSPSIIDFNGYFIESDGGQLNTGGWASLESVDQDGNGVPNDGVGWEAFDSTDASYLAEGFLTGSTSLGPGESLALGNAYNPAIAGVENDGDLSFVLTDATGRSIPSSLFSTVEYVTGGVVGIPGDFSGSGAVGNDDLTLLLDNWGATVPPVPVGWINDAPTAPAVGNDDLTRLLDNWGNSALSGISAVPEPSTGLLMLLSGSLIAAFGYRRNRGVQTMDYSIALRKTGSSVAGLLIVLMLAGSTVALENDRDYTLGDDPAEGATANAAVGAQTFDSAGTVGAGDLQDLNSSGGPVFRAVDGGSGRPGASTGDLGIEFDGTNDVLFTPISMNAPTQMYNNSMYFPGPPPQIFPHNYGGIFSHGIQLWAKPTVTGTDQVLVLDSPENGITITANDTWGLWFDAQDGPAADSGVEVASTVDANGWAHVMQLAGFSSPITGGTAFEGALLVNGVAVVTRGGAYDPSSEPLSIGAAVTLDESGLLETSSNHYTGVLDDVRVFFWGDNSGNLGDDNAVGGTNTAVGSLNADGKNWGALNLNQDNDWIAQRLATLAADAGVGSIPDTDLDFDGDTDGDDENLFIANWRNENLVNGIRIGDWNSRQKGDINYDGITDLVDALMMHHALAPLGGFHFDRLGAQVPEPATVLLVSISVAILSLRRRRA